MANDESVLREVEQELAEDRQREFFRKYGGLVIAGAAAIVLGVAGWQGWQGFKRAESAKAATAYHEALKALEADAEDGRTRLAMLAEETSGGYAVLAKMRRAGSLAVEGDREGALTAYREVAGDSGAPSSIRNLARLRAAYLSLADGRAAAEGDLGTLASEESPFGHYAREIAAVAALDAGAYDEARAMFERAIAAEATPAPVRQRAEEFAALAAAGAAGVNIKGEARVEDLMRALDALSAGEAPGDHSHDGHDHGDEPHDRDTPSEEPGEEQ